MNRPLGDHAPVAATAGRLLGHMDRAGVRRALVWHVGQHDGFPGTGNEMLTEAIAGQERLTACWTLLPTCCRELGGLDEFFGRAGEAHVRALRAFPAHHRFLLRREAVGDILQRMIEIHMPLMVRVPGDVSWESLYDLLAGMPDLTVILTGMGCWGTDRLFRPLLDRYPNVYVETSSYITDGGIEAFVERYGGGRMLFGSDFPDRYLGAMMLAIAHAEISDSAKQAIAGGNLDRLLSGVKL